MKKRASRFFAIAMTLVMVLSMTAVLSGCGEEKTLENYFAENPEEQEALDQQVSSLSQPGMDMKVEIKENAIIYALQFEETFDEEQVKEFKKVFATSMKSLGPTFEGIAKSCEEQTEIKGITCQVIFKNGDGAELYNETFEAAK